jgi:glycosyltransferase involved in cell wall biosynthesis
LSFSKPVVSHFGSTTYGFLKSTPRTHCIDDNTKKIFYILRKKHVIPELNIQTRRPLRDVTEIERYVAQRATKIIATSDQVRKELIDQQVNSENIIVIHNAIENFWFSKYDSQLKTPHLIFIGRLGNDSFTWKLKGLDRLLHVYQNFPDNPKLSFFMTTNDKLDPWIQKNIHKHIGYYNLLKLEIKNILQQYFGSIFLLTSRYEGFSLSLIEAMSQGLVPIVYPVGVASEIIVNDINGFIVQNQKEMVLRIKTLLFDSKKRLYMAHNSRATAARFKVNLLVNSLINNYHNIIKTR